MELVSGKGRISDDPMLDLHLPTAADHMTAQSDDTNIAIASSPRRQPHGLFFAAVFVSQILLVAFLSWLWAPRIVDDDDNSDVIVIDVDVDLLADPKAQLWCLIAVVVLDIVFSVLWLDFLLSIPNRIMAVSTSTCVFVQAMLGLIFLYVHMIPQCVLLCLLSGSVSFAAKKIRNRQAATVLLLQFAADILSFCKSLTWAIIAVQAVAGAWFIACSAILYGILHSEMDSSSLATAALLVVLSFWTIEVARNVVRVTTINACCGDQGHTTWSFLSQALMTSFGSICLGSAVVAFVRVLRALMRRSAQRSPNACFDCFLTCAHVLIKHVTKHAFVYVAIYGDSFVRSSKRTYELFERIGFDPVIQADSSWLLTASSGLLGGAVSSAFAGYFMAYWLDLDVFDGTFFMMMAFMIGSVMPVIVLTKLTAASSAVLVHVAEEPQALEEAYPQMYQAFREVLAKEFPEVTVL